MSEVRKIKSKLNKENKQLYIKLLNYIYANGVNTKVLKEIKLDLAGMLLENQERGEDAVTVVGKDYNLFCDELIGNCPRKRMIDYLIEFLLTASIVVALGLPCLFLISLINPTEDSFTNGWLYISKPFMFSLMLTIACSSILVSFINQKYVFSKVVTSLYFPIYFSITLFMFIIINIVVKMLMRKAEMLQFNVIIVVAIACICLLLTYLVREWRSNNQMNKFKDAY